MSKKIGDMLRKYRTNCNLTQQQVADALNIDRTTYTCYECNRTEPNIEMLKKLTKLYNISYNDLLPYDSQQKTGVADYRYGSSANREKLYELSNFEQQIILKLRLMSAEDRFEFLNNIEDDNG